MAKSNPNPLPKYTIRACMVWIVPVLSVLFGFVLFIPFVMSAALTPIEVPKFRDQLFGKRARRQLPCLRAPAIMRLVVLWVIQIWWIIIWRAGMDAPEVIDELYPPDGLLPENSDAPAPSGLRGAMLAINGKRRGPALEPSPKNEAHLSWSPKTLSVVLPCAGEGEFALKTVKSIWDSTPATILHEIIVVDDGSDPPLGKSHLTPSVLEKYHVKLIRHPSTVGLIGTKQDGGVAATGDIIVFFDCHVAPQPGWHTHFLRLIGENYKRVIVPMITDLDISTWTEKSASGGMAKCYLTWDADFKWFSSDDPYVPVLSGGLLGISRVWWNATRGYDEHMRGWGGENLDQSLRTWLCGGEIMMARDAHVAHMWRKSDDARTHPKYDIPENAAQKNRMRAAVAWFGDYAEKLRQFPELRAGEQGADGQPWYGDISNINSVRTDLKCKSYSWFMHRFKHVYEDGGLIPRQTFLLRAASSASVVSDGQCLTYLGQAGTSPDGRGAAELRPCNARDERQRWHEANRDTSKASQPCCSGVRAWNTDQCIATAEDGKVQTFVCDVSGAAEAQVWQLTSDGKLQQKTYLGHSCIEASTGTLETKSCSSSAGIWIKDNSVEPIESRLYRQASLNGFVA